MVIKSVIGAVSACLLICGTSIVHAATVNFSPTSITANVNDVISLNIIMDFTDEPTLGGGTDIFYDSSALSVQSFSFASTTLILDPFFVRAPDVKPDKLEGFAFGNFNGLSGPGIVGTVSFKVLTSGNTTLRMAVTTCLLCGGGFNSDIGTQVVSFGSANVSAVPIPAAIWLFGSGLLGLVGIARKQMKQ